VLRIVAQVLVLSRNHPHRKWPANPKRRVVPANTPHILGSVRFRGDAGRRRSSRKSRRRRAVEKTRAAPAWKTLRVSHFPTAPAAAVPTAVICCPTRRVSHYEWTKNGGRSLARKTRFFAYVATIMIVTAVAVPANQRLLRSSRVVTPELAGIAAAREYPYMTSVNILGHDWWEMLWADFLLDKKLYFETSIYEGRFAGALEGDWDLVHSADILTGHNSCSIPLSREYVLKLRRAAAPEFDAGCTAALRSAPKNGVVNPQLSRDYAAVAIARSALRRVPLRRKGLGKRHGSA
jgi:hypothetical protein